MSTYLLLRTAKTVALLALTGGVAISVSHPDAAARRRAVDGLALPGLLGIWTAGYGLSKITERSLGSPAIVVAMLASWVALVLLDRSPTDRAPRAALIGVLAGATFAMHLRDSDSVVTGAAAGGALVAVASWFGLGHLPTTEPDREGARRRFRAAAFLETLTTGALFLIDMPARHGFGVHLDGGLGLFGWVHGAAVLGYLTLTLTHHHALGGSKIATALRLLAGIVPFASLWVLHRTARNTSGTPSSA